MHRNAALLVAALLLTAGCLGGGTDGASSPSADRSGDDNPSGGEGERADARAGGANATSWTLNATLTLGWQAAVGAGGTGGTNSRGISGSDHCPHGTFEVPTGAWRLQLVASAETVDPEEQGAGGYSLVIEPPEGDPIYLDWASQQTIDEDQMDFTEREPDNGTWTARVEANGPAVNHRWDLALTVDGAGTLMPAGLAPTATC